MQAILLNSDWHYRLSSDETAYHLPAIDDSAWLTFNPDRSITPTHDTKYIWLRIHFEMHPNDECSVWWLEFTERLAHNSQLWVNYERLVVTPDNLNAPRWDITFAVAMGDNVVTLCVPILHWQAPLWAAACVPYPCHG